MPLGRPTKYDPAMCEEVEAFMGQGYSRMAAAGHIGICYDTFHEWVKANPAFSEAVKRGMAKRTIFLERDLLEAESGPKVTSRIFALKNAAPDEWKDRVAIGGDKTMDPIQTEEVGSGAAKLAAYLDAIASRTSGEPDA